MNRIQDSSRGSDVEVGEAVSGIHQVEVCPGDDPRAESPVDLASAPRHEEVDHIF